jgi:pimeloyl-ACP methyl ester carboxylesterase
MEERDVELGLNASSWPGDMPAPETWTTDRDAGAFRRRINGNESADEEAPLREKILRFPSAPIHALHRLSQDQVNMGPVESFHTLRLLSHPESQGKVTRIFLLHNGLNETRRMTLYYQLASYLIAQDRGTVCILRPFPGHLTRCAFPGLTETPLDHYLWDGLHLFRQFLRYMIETRWLLSCIARYSYYHCFSGSGLLGESKRIADSRLKDPPLAKEMAEEWEALRNASKAAIDDNGADSPPMPKPPTRGAFKQSIVSLREALMLDKYPESDGSSFSPRAEPKLHVIGYSLGGFAAQSVFMSWPFLISSCSTLLSGGAMRELAPTAFADPEEWQTVLHSLRYELDDAMLDWRFKSDDGCVAGINSYLFLYLKRAFYEVFQQEYRGSFQTRLVSFRQRMLFVAGGNDPIVRPQSVLDSGPPDGINMLTVGGLGHFLGDSPESKAEKEQRSFWIPEIGRMIGRLATDAADKHRESLKATWLDEDDLLPESYGRKKRRKKGEVVKLERLSIAERLEVERDGTLPSHLFQRSLDDLLSRVDEVGEDPDENGEEPDDISGGLLFILKNEVPTFLLDERSLQLHASALYHEDVGTADYIAEVRARRPILERRRKRVCVILPWNVQTIMRKIDAGFQHPSQSEGFGEQMMMARDPDLAWSKLDEKCREWTGDPHEDAVRVFDGKVENEALDITELCSAAHERLDIGEPDQPIQAALPDCWVWMSHEFFGRKKGSTPRVEASAQAICENVPKYVAKTKKAEREIAELLRADDLRMVTLSRARYNPRFRGRIIAEPRQAQELLLRAALCIVSSVPFKSFNFKAGTARGR